MRQAASQQKHLTDGELANELRLRQGINCIDRKYESTNIVQSQYWVMVNYIRANHVDLRCCSTVTYTTHGDYRYLENVVPLLERWRAPISFALYAPGLDFRPTVMSILWLRECDPQRELIQQWVSFHIYFNVDHIPQEIPKEHTLLKWKVNCNEPAPFLNVPRTELYRLQKRLEYPINVGRNVARNAALTHFVLASDIELYPSPGLANGFLQMLSRNPDLLKSRKNIVYPLNIFEVHKKIAVPDTKSKLQYLLAKGHAQSFHIRLCAACHSGPRLQEWINSMNSSNTIKVSHVSKRTAQYNYWEPIYIGTINDPPYDERFTWEGMWDKLTQAYALCVLDYEFHTLDNAFLVHKPGIKRSIRNQARLAKGLRTYQYIQREILFEFYEKYGWHPNCSI
ncbi:hypothetical protein ACLKA7_003104 [Drosophila subpalustris]